MSNLKIAIASDHGGYKLKTAVKQWLLDNSYIIEDFGTNSEESCDYPIFAKKVATAVVSGEFDRGILICGTGIGMSIMANRFKGIRASLVENAFSAAATRAHNDSNILCLGERVLGTPLALEIVKTWLTTEYEGGRHQKRLDMLE